MHTRNWLIVASRLLTIATIGTIYCTCFGCSPIRSTKSEYTVISQIPERGEDSDHASRNGKSDPRSMFMLRASDIAAQHGYRVASMPDGITCEYPGTGSSGDGIRTHTIVCTAKTGSGGEQVIRLHGCTIPARGWRSDRLWNVAERNAYRHIVDTIREMALEIPDRWCDEP